MDSRSEVKRSIDLKVWKVKVMKKNVEILERFVPVEMSDKMFLKNITEEFCSRYHDWPNNVYPSGEIVGKFLMIHYNMRDVDWIRAIVYDQPEFRNIAIEYLMNYCKSKDL